MVEVVALVDHPMITTMVITVVPVAVVFHLTTQAQVLLVKVMTVAMYTRAIQCLEVPGEVVQVHPEVAILLLVAAQVV